MHTTLMSVSVFHLVVFSTAIILALPESDYSISMRGYKYESKKPRRFALQPNDIESTEELRFNEPLYNEVLAV